MSKNIDSQERRFLEQLYTFTPSCFLSVYNFFITRIAAAGVQAVRSPICVSVLAAPARVRRRARWSSSSPSSLVLGSICECTRGRRAHLQSRCYRGCTVCQSRARNPSRMGSWIGGRPPKVGGVAWQQARGRRRCTGGRTVPLGGTADHARQLMLEHLGHLVLSGCAKCCAKC